MAKVTRHNHPLMVNARRESYNAGLADGYKRVYEQASKDANVICNNTAERLTKFYKTIISGLENKINTMEKVIKGFEDIQIIINENNDMPNSFPSTAGIKYRIGGQLYGFYYGFDKPELTKAEIVEAANYLLKEMINRLGGNQNG